ncbi:hypothetical protein D3C78_1778840 [compost metagenome]
MVTPLSLTAVTPAMVISSRISGPSTESVINSAKAARRCSMASSTLSRCAMVYSPRWYEKSRMWLATTSTDENGTR